MPRPGTLPVWATNANYTGGPAVGTPSVVAPSGAVQAEGWEPGQKPGAQNQNWWQNLVYQWINWLSGSALVKLGEQALTAASGTYTPSTGTLAVKVKGIAGGAGGGGVLASANNTGSAAGGGASGTYFEKWIFPGGGTLVTGGAYVCGAGGAGGDGNIGGAQDGQVGADATIVIQGVTYTLKGGGGGHADVSGNADLPRLGTEGGAPQGGSSTGDVNSSRRGGYGLALAALASPHEYVRGGDGGPSPWGGEGAGGNATNGSAATGYGAGGGGGSCRSAGSTVTGTGGAGAPSKFIIEEYG